MGGESLAGGTCLHVLIHQGLKVAGAVQHLDDSDSGFFSKVSIKDHVLWKAGNEYPTQSCKSCDAKTAKRPRVPEHSTRNESPDPLPVPSVELTQGPKSE